MTITRYDRDSHYFPNYASDAWYIPANSLLYFESKTWIVCLTRMLYWSKE